jgi:AraC-like DNA-binding protein
MVSGSRLYLFDHQFLFLGNIQDNSEHKHHAVQIIVGLDGPIMLTFDNSPQSCHSVMIASDTLHQFGGNQGTQLHLLIDNESILARKLTEKYFHQENVYIFDESHAQQLRKRFIFSEESGMSCSEAHLFVNGLLETIIDRHSIEIKKTYDPRIQQALVILQQSLVEKIVAKEIARQVCLSESRFIHLFSEEIGIPLRKFMLWLRLNRAIQEISSGKSLTDAAYSSGFSDSAHLSRTFRSMFGLTLSKIFKNSRFVQVFSCLSS